MTVPSWMNHPTTDDPGLGGPAAGHPAVVEPVVGHPVEGHPALGRRVVGRLAGLAGVAMLAGAGTACSRRTTLDRLDIACGEPGGTYIRFGRAVSDAVLADGLARRSEALVTAGSVENLDRLGAGSAALAMCLADSARTAPAPVVAIGRVYQNYLQVVVPARSPVESVEELRGRPASIGAPSSGTAATARTVLGALGLLAPSPRPVDVVELALAEAIARLRAGRLAAFVFSSGIPIPALTEIAEEFPVRLLDLTDVLGRLPDGDREVYTPAVVPAATYEMPRDVTTVGVANLLLARPDLPDDSAARLVDLVLGRARELVPPLSTGLQFLTRQTLVDTAPVALHPGAAERYRELHG
ncbi:MAG: TAXI family TRAP transporter solute-binding subunit [Dermatophilaceae bacterium]